MDKIIGPLKIVGEPNGEIMDMLILLL